MPEAYQLRYHSPDTLFLVLSLKMASPRLSLRQIEYAEAEYIPVVSVLEKVGSSRDILSLFEDRACERAMCINQNGRVLKHPSMRTNGRWARRELYL